MFTMKKVDVWVFGYNATYIREWNSCSASSYSNKYKKY